MKKHSRTNDELVIRLWDVEEVRDLMARHCYCYGGDMRREELNELWVSEPQNRRTASLGYNNGFYVGMDNIASHYVADNEKKRYEQLKAYCDTFSEIDYSKENLGIGVMNIHTLNTPVIYISEDGHTAKYMGYDCGLLTDGKPDGTADAHYIFGMTYADLIKESSGWKIWHMVIQRDHNIDAEKGYGETPCYIPFGTDPMDAEFGTPTVARIVYDPFYGWEYMYQDMPHPYYTYNELHSYGPEGDMGLPYYVRERRDV